MADEKKILRRLLIESRSELPASTAARLSGLVQRNLIEASCYVGATSVALYAAQNNEVATALIFAHATASGRHVFYPRIIPERHELSLVRVDHPAQLQPGRLGILEPTGSEIASQADLACALICVPGVAFSPAGQRIGRGGGYYDRFIAALAPQTVTAGLAYSYQVLDRLPESPIDRRLSLIITESAVHRAAAGIASASPERADQGGITRCC